jgi:23S rRNA G2445 N2-methylase RlmL
MALIRFFAPCPRGLEASLAAELRAIGAGILGEPPGGVQFEGDTRIGLAANLHSRIASRILQQVASAPYHNEDDLYRIASETPWETWHEPLASLRIDLNSSGSTLHSLQFATLRIKDGVVDRLRERYGERPSIERQRPERRIFAFIDASQCTLYLDWSGESLFKRGWRRDGADAPLKENLAAALLLRAGWPALAAKGAPLVDPMCGSGTLLIEGALIALDFAPGLLREVCGCARWGGHDAALWDTLLDEARARQPPRGDHAHGAEAAAEVEYGLCGGAPSRAVPRGQHIVGGEAMAVSELEQSEVTADGVQRLARFDGGLAGHRAGWDGAGLGPAFEEGALIKSIFHVPLSYRTLCCLSTEKTPTAVAGPNGTDQRDHKDHCDHDYQ